MLIESMLSRARTRAKITGGSKKRLIETIASVFAEDVQNLNVDELYQHLLNREKLGTTGIGGGIAIPHCRFNTGGATYCVCLTLDQPIDFDAVDDQPVDVIFAMLVPEDAENDHLKILAGLAEVLQNPAFVKNLRATKDDEVLFKTIVGKLETLGRG